MFSYIILYLQSNGNVNVNYLYFTDIHIIISVNLYTYPNCWYTISYYISMRVGYMCLRDEQNQPAA